MKLETRPRRRVDDAAWSCRDPQKIYHHRPLDELKKLAPTLAWDAYLGALGFPGLAAFNVAEPDVLKKLDAMSKSVPMAASGGRTCAGTWRRGRSPYLSQKFVDEWFQLPAGPDGHQDAAAAVEALRGDDRPD